MEFCKNRILKFDLNSNIGLKWYYISHKNILLFFLNLNISKFSISQLKKNICGTSISNISDFNSKYCIGFEIPTPDSPKLNQ